MSQAFSHIEIDRPQRDALRESVILDLIDLGELEKLITSDRMTEARAVRIHRARDMSLLDDLGWEEDERRQRFELKLPPADLETVVGYLREVADERLRFWAEDLGVGGYGADGEIEAMQRDIETRDRIDLEINTMGACSFVLRALQRLDDAEWSLPDPEVGVPLPPSDLRSSDSAG